MKKGTFTVTGIPPKYDGKYATFGAAIADGNETAIFGAESGDAKTEKFTLSRISNGTVNIPTWRSFDKDKYDRYSGNDTCKGAVLVIFNEGTATSKDAITAGGAISTNMFMSVAFSNGGAEKAWTDGVMNDVMGMLGDLGEREEVKEGINAIKGIFSGLGRSGEIKDGINAIKGIFSGLGKNEEIKDGISTLKGAFSELRQKGEIKEGISNLKNKLSEFSQKEEVKDAVNTLKGLFKKQ